MAAVPVAIPPSASPHIHVDSSGVAWIEGSAVKVREVVLDRLVHGWSPEEIHFQHPTLSLAQIHAAFVWYYDHQTEVDAEIERTSAAVETDAASAGTDSPLVLKLRRLGHLR